MKTKKWVPHTSSARHIRFQTKHGIVCNVKNCEYNKPRPDIVKWLDNRPFEASVLPWLEGRVTGTIKVVHNGKVHNLWSISDAVGDGITIETAVYAFCMKHNIDLLKEANG